MEFLQNHSEPFEEVKVAFLRTHNTRRNIFQLQGISIFDYMSNNVKALHLNTEGPFLVTIIKIKYFYQANTIDIIKKENYKFRLIWTSKFYTKARV